MKLLGALVCGLLAGAPIAHAGSTANVSPETGATTVAHAIARAELCQATRLLGLRSSVAYCRAPRVETWGQKLELGAKQMLAGGEKRTSM